MSIFLRNQRIYKEETIISLSKPIKKEKRKNQYTIEFKFGSDVDVSKLRQIIQVNQQIPPFIPLDLTFKLESDILIPFQLNPNLYLGALAIDPISYNYKIARYEKHENNYIFYFEPIDKPYTPLQVVKNTLEKYHPSLGEQIELFHFNLLQKMDKMNFTAENDVKEYQNKIKNSFAAFIQKKQKGRITTLIKTINSQYLQLMGINDDILQDYIHQTGLLPWCFPIENQQLANLIQGMFQGAFQETSSSMQATNFNGQKFEVKIIPKTFHIYNQEDDSYLQIMFFQQEYNKQIITQNQISLNMYEYFNLKHNVLKKNVNQDDQVKRCKYRII